MKFKILMFLMFLGKLSYSQLNKNYFLFVNPISILCRNPTMGLEIKLKNVFFNAIQFEGSYMFQDKRIGGFLYKGYKAEKSTITDFESYPFNRIPIYVYNGTTYRLSCLKYFYTKSVNQYISFSLAGKILSYDSLEVNYSNTPKVKRESIFDQSGYYTHTRKQNEKMRAIGIGVEYGLRRSIDNIIFNFFIRGNLFYANRKIVSFHEEFNYYINDHASQTKSDQLVHMNSFNTIQIRPQIGIRIGFANF